MLKIHLENAKGAWGNELLSVLWAYRTTSKVFTIKMLFNLVYGMEALIPVKIEIGFPRVNTFDEERNFEAMRINLYLIEEQSDRVSTLLATYHRKVASYCNFRVKNKLLRYRDLILRKSTSTNALRDERKL